MPWLSPGMKLRDKFGKPGGMMAGMAWVGSARVGVRAMSVLSTVILARLLTPEDFGLVAVATSLVGLLEFATDFGFNSALVHYRDASEEEYATAWTLGVFRGLALSLLLLAVVNPLAAFLDDSRLVPVLAVLALLPLIQGMESIRYIDFEKNMLFGPTFFLMVSVKLASLLVTIGLAVAWRSYWALIVGSVFACFFRTAMTYVLAPYRPRLALTAWRKLLGFSGWLAGAQFVSAIGGRLNSLIMAKILAAYAVGIFSMANQLTVRSFQEITAPLQRVLFPRLSRLPPGSNEFRRIYLAGTSGLFMILTPVGVGLALVAPDAVPVLLGDQWGEAIRPIQWLSLTVAFSVFGTMVRPAALATGRTRMLFWRSMLLLPISPTLVAAGSWYYGLDGAIAGASLAQVASGLFDLSIMNRILGLKVWEQLWVFRRSFLALLAMTICVAAVQRVLPGPTGIVNPAIRLVTSVAVGVMVYPVSHLLLWRASGSPAGPEEKIVTLLSLWWRGRFASAH